MLSRRLLLAAAGMGAGMSAFAPARASEHWYPLVDHAGKPLMNFRIPVEIETELMQLESVLSVGAEDADVTLVEVYDSNCGWCRYGAREIKHLVEADPDLKLKLVNAPGLGPQSVQAARVELAVKRLAGEEKAIAFHDEIFKLRGVVDGRRALRVATEFGLDAEEVEKTADTDEVGRVVAEAARLAQSLNLAVTPAFLVGGTALVGWAGTTTLMQVVASVRHCDKPVCA